MKDLQELNDRIKILEYVVAISKDVLNKDIKPDEKTQEIREKASWSRRPTWNIKTT